MLTQVVKIDYNAPTLMPSRGFPLKFMFRWSMSMIQCKNGACSFVLKWDAMYDIPVPTQEPAENQYVKVEWNLLHAFMVS